MTPTASMPSRATSQAPYLPSGEESTPDTPAGSETVAGAAPRTLTCSVRPETGGRWMSTA